MSASSKTFIPPKASDIATIIQASKGAALTQELNQVPGIESINLTDIATGKTLLAIAVGRFAAASDNLKAAKIALEQTQKAAYEANLAKVHALGDAPLDDDIRAKIDESTREKLEAAQKSLAPKIEQAEVEVSESRLLVPFLKSNIGGKINLGDARGEAVVFYSLKQNSFQELMALDSRVTNKEALQIGKIYGPEKISLLHLAFTTKQAESFVTNSRGSMPIDTVIDSKVLDGTQISTTVITCALMTGQLRVALDSENFTGTVDLSSPLGKDCIGFADDWKAKLGPLISSDKITGEIAIDATVKSSGRISLDNSLAATAMVNGNFDFVVNSPKITGSLDLASHAGIACTYYATVMDGRSGTNLSEFFNSPRVKGALDFNKTVLGYPLVTHASFQNNISSFLYHLGASGKENTSVNLDLGMTCPDEKMIIEHPINKETILQYATSGRLQITCKPEQVRTVQIKLDRFELEDMNFKMEFIATDNTVLNTVTHKDAEKGHVYGIKGAVVEEIATKYFAARTAENKSNDGVFCFLTAAHDLETVSAEQFSELELTVSGGNGASSAGDYWNVV